MGGITWRFDSQYQGSLNDHFPNLHVASDLFGKIERTPLSRYSSEDVGVLFIAA
jgi:hypothetical protein